MYGWQRAFEGSIHARMTDSMAAIQTDGAWGGHTSKMSLQLDTRRPRYPDQRTPVGIGTSLPSLNKNKNESRVSLKNI